MEPVLQPNSYILIHVDVYCPIKGHTIPVDIHYRYLARREVVSCWMLLNTAIHGDILAVVSTIYELN